MEVVQAAVLIQDLGILGLLVAVGAFPLDILFVAARGGDHQRMQILVVRHAHRVYAIGGMWTASPAFSRWDSLPTVHSTSPETTKKVSQCLGPDGEVFFRLWG